MVYLDLLFVQNVLIDYLLLSLTSTWRNQPARRWRLLAAAFLGGMYVLFFFFLAFGFMYTFITKILFSGIMVMVAFGFGDWRGYLRLVCAFYMTAFLVGGGVIAFYWLLQSQVDVLYYFQFLRAMDMTQLSVMCVLAVGYPLSWIFARSTYRSLRHQKLKWDHLIRVEGEICGQCFQCIGLVDTGNQLYDPLSRIPVMMIEVTVLPFLPQQILRWVEESKEACVVREMDRIDDLWASRLRFIPYRTIGQQQSWLIALRPEQLSLWTSQRKHEVQKVLIGLTSTPLSPDGAYQAIVHPSLLQYQAN